MPASLSVTAFTTAAAVLVIAEQRNPGAGAAFVALDPDKQDYAVDTAAIGIKSLDISAQGLARDDAAWRLEQANIEYALYLAPSFSDDATADPLNPENADSSNVKREKVAALEVEYFTRPVLSAGSLDVFPPVVRTLLAPLLVSNVLVIARGYGSGKARRVS